ncbi:ATP-binding protein [Alteromonas sp. 1_MG-2023]|uniref:sensor histidine kinase n=1 Tax=unclassified Alteromonas TaxID=2614992 RepID=UPI0026E16094|nr:ATP-binding protein [Alteromonas sp. 1_MG-2023]MDO6475888.1 ATP-binding protein [Alteromonas sp. 1_MG-2023]
MTQHENGKSADQLQLELEQKDRLIDSLQKDLRDAQRQLLQAEKMASVGQLAAGVAHEINNPVGFVSSNLSTLADYVHAYQEVMTQVLKLASPENTEQDTIKSKLASAIEEHDIEFISEDILALVDESAEGLERVSEIVRGLRLFSRIDSDDRQWFDINQCMRTTLSMVNNKLKYICQQELRLEDIPKVYINVGKITQIFTNLLINAGQAIESTGKQGQIIVKSWHEGDYVHISVTDSGSGIKQEHLDKLFHPFFTTKPEGQGTGLGLSISFGIAEEHGGELKVASKEGVGSTFTLSLPTTGPEDEQEPESDC